MHVPLCIHNSSLEGATELKFAPLRFLSDGFFCRNQKFDSGRITRTIIIVLMCFRCTLSIAGAVAFFEAFCISFTY